MRLDTPIGPLTVVAPETGLRAVLFDGQAPPPDAADSPVLDAAAAQLSEWFAGARRRSTSRLISTAPPRSSAAPGSRSPRSRTRRRGATASRRAGSDCRAPLAPSA